MNIKRKNTSFHLRRMADGYKGSQSQEDLEDAEYFQTMAAKNDIGTLTIKEAQEVAEMFEGDNPLIVDAEGERWVESG